MKFIIRLNLQLKCSLLCSLFCFFALLCLSQVSFIKSSEAETIYSWQDQAGRIHYGSKPPANSINKQEISNNSFSKYSSKRLMKGYGLENSIIGGKKASQQKPPSATSNYPRARLGNDSFDKLPEAQIAPKRGAFSEEPIKEPAKKITQFSDTPKIQKISQEPQKELTPRDNYRIIKPRDNNSNRNGFKNPEPINPEPVKLDPAKLHHSKLNNALPKKQIPGNQNLSNLESSNKVPPGQEFTSDSKNLTKNISSLAALQNAAPLKRPSQNEPRESEFSPKKEIIGLEESNINKPSLKLVNKTNLELSLFEPNLILDAHQQVVAISTMIRNNSENKSSLRAYFQTFDQDNKPVFLKANGPEEIPPQTLGYYELDRESLPLENGSSKEILLVIKAQ